AEFLDRGKHGRQLVGIRRAARTGKREAILEGIEAVSVRLAIIDREADKIHGRLAVAPVHRDKAHAFASMKLQGERSSRVGALDLEFVHRPSRIGGEDIAYATLSFR